MFCCMSDSKIAPQENMIMIDKKKADKYGISIERYYKLLGYPNMTRELIILVIFYIIFHRYYGVFIHNITLLISF